MWSFLFYPSFFSALAIRESSRPAKKGYIVRVIPTRKCSAFNVQPPLTSPLGLVMAK
jgi:hypothetical protein